MKKSYDRNNNPNYIPSSPINHTIKWRKEFMEESRKKYGAWWIFSGTSQIKREGKKLRWIERYRKTQLNQKGA